MKTMYLFITIILLSSCSKEEIEKPALNGTWNLNRVDLYEGDLLNGSNIHEETTTTYRFIETKNKKELVITEDGVSEIFTYSYDKSSRTIQLGTDKIFNVEELSSTTLVLSSVYVPYKSTYIFDKAG